MTDQQPITTRRLAAATQAAIPVAIPVAMMAALLAVSPVAAQTEVAPDNWVTPGTAEGNPIFRARGTTPRSPRSSAVRVAARG
ncbi:MAG: hypothetical protein CL477_07365 [Acidobacteria bacterium]|nr:hypothetical protein [Acidobacteriota bacterium]MDP7338654.1 hypothetical protein [Vicinamibacterales bacterium]MDP7481036.1 hypothetical protein [Vicinamibacterales bacterium]MDP7693538.1 hypothetical protein [Vicinamibacterales bacterium]HJN44971.1 hypothetical protein [Vicinamibacterales bacterium]